MKKPLLAIVITSILTFSAFAFATTVLRLDVSELVKRSELIVIADVVETKAEMIQGRVHTRATLAIKDTLKGEKHNAIDLLHLGGRTPDLVTYVPGMPSFEKGEHLLLFLNQPKDQKFFVVVGLEQGKFTVADGHAYPTPNHAHLLPAPTAHPNDGALQAPHPQRSWELSEVQSLIQKFAEKREDEQ